MKTNTITQKKIDYINWIDDKLWRALEFNERLWYLLAEWKNIQKDIQEIDDYYSSKEYMKDLDLADHNKFPEDTRLWAFSEDWIWNMLWEYHELTKEIHQLTWKILKKLEKRDN